MANETKQHLITEGLILREYPSIAENDRFVAILTKDRGLLRASARGAKKLHSRLGAGTQLLCYARLHLIPGRDKYIVEDARPIEVFFSLRQAVEKLALAQYFCELAYLMVPEDTDSEEYLRLILNSLHFLSKGTRPIRLLQSVTELRMLSSAGYMPNLVACENCAAYEAETMFFLPQRGIILCDKCFHGANEPYVALPPGVLTAMRHIAYVDFEKLYNFSLPEDALKILNAATESYVVHTLHTVPKTLEFYKTFLD